MALEATEPWERAKVVAIRRAEAALPVDLASLPVVESSGEDWAEIADTLVVTHPSLGQVPQADFDEEVALLLDELGLRWRREPVVRGLKPDFLVEFPNGRRAALEVKTHDYPSLVEATRARSQAARLAEATGADAAFAVYRAVDDATVGQGIVDLERLGSKLSRLMSLPERAEEPTAEEERSPPNQPTVFAVMPFAPEYSDVFWVAMRKAAQAVGAGCVLVDEEDYHGDVVPKIKQLISTSDAVIADL